MKLSIADFIIEIISDTAVVLEDGYLPFVSNTEAEADMRITCFSGILHDLLKDKELLFEAKSDDQRYYSIFRVGNRLGFQIFEPQMGIQTQQIALLDESLTRWEVYSEPMADGRLMPLKYPMGPIVMYYLTVNSYAVMIHASGVFDGEKGRVFTGFSGRGKSTISGIWAENGNQIINDDRLIIRKCKDGFYFYNTPMFYRDMPKRAPLHSIHLIRHASENIVERVSGVRAISKVLAFCIQNNYDKRFVQNNLRVMSEICSKTSVYETGFVPDKSIVHHILEHEG